jgi:hypothetical protein
LRVETAYEKARRPNKRMGVDTCLNEFCNAYNDAHKMSLPIVDKYRALLHFPSAAKTLNPVWASTRETLLLDASHDNKPSVADLIESFIRRRGIQAAEQALAKAVGTRSATAFVSINNLSLVRLFQWQTR